MGFLNVSDDFDIEDYYDDDDFFEEEFAHVDALIEAIGYELDALEGLATLYITNPVRVSMMRFCCLAMKRAMRGSTKDVNFIVGRSKLEPSMGYVDIEGAPLTIRDTEWFARAAEFADNTEIYPLKDNRVRMTFTFHGLLMPIASNG